MKHIKNLRVLQPILYLLIFSNLGCEKLVDIDPPVNTIVSEQTFSDYENVNSAVNGVYAKLYSSSNIWSFGNSWITYFCGLSADELVPFTVNQIATDYYRNVVRPDNGQLPQLWNRAYGIIYQANVCIEGIANSVGLSNSIKERFIGELKFIRAFCYYYLTGLFGDVPFVTSSLWENNSARPRTNVAEIRSKIIDDLIEAEKSSPSLYSMFNNERVKVTKWAIYTLLSKLYLDSKIWDKADHYSSLVISNNLLFELKPSLLDVFKKNSSEAILQFHHSSRLYPYNVLPEGNLFIPRTNSNPPPSVYISKSLIESFDTNDLRKKNWVGETNYNGVSYPYPFKYTVGPGQLVVNGPVPEYYMVFRLAEVILIRAEARIGLNNLGGAVSDINSIRNRAGLTSLSTNNLDSLKMFLLSESRKELFCEWGNRWFALKRTGAIDSVMTKSAIEKGAIWEPFRRIFPINATELNLNPLATQNSGYN